MHAVKMIARVNYAQSRLLQDLFTVEDISIILADKSVRVGRETVSVLL